MLILLAVGLQSVLRSAHEFSQAYDGSYTLHARADTHARTHTHTHTRTRTRTRTHACTHACAHAHHTHTICHAQHKALLAE